MDEETRRFIREAEWTRMRAREDDARFHEQQEFEDQQAYQKRVAYVMKYGRQRAVVRTLMKWTIGSLILAIIVFPGMWERDGLGQALIYLLMSPVFGCGIGIYQAAKLPNVEE
jgi:hypothetical protein